MSRFAASRAGVVTCLGLVLLVGLWPWAATVALWPMAADSPSWFELSDPARPAWADWVFRTRHFGVGYRPLTALSFTATTAWADGSALVARVTDLLLHAAAGIGVYALGRALAPRLSRLGPGLAMALFLAHPITGEVVPILARRSYSLSLALSTWALVAVGCGARVDGMARRILAGLAAGVGLAAAWFANEVAAIVVLASPLVAWTARGASGNAEGPGEGPGAGPTEGYFLRATAAAHVLVPAAVLVLLAVLVRARVLGTLGGYEVDEDAAASAGAIVAACFRQLLGAARGQPLAGALRSGTVAVLAAAAVAGIAASLIALRPRAVGSSAVGSRARAKGAYAAARGVVVVGGLWVGIGVATYALLGVLYPRQLYVLAPPLALALGMPLGSALRALRGAPLGAVLVLNGLAVAGILTASPVFRGQDADRLALWRHRQALMEALVSAGRGAEAPATMSLVLPATERAGGRGGARLHAVEVRRGGRKRAFVRWVAFVLRDRDVLVEEFLELTGAGAAGAEAPRVERSGAAAFVVLPEGVEARAAAGRLQRDGANPARIRVNTRGNRVRQRYVFLYWAGVWVLEPL